MTYFIWMEKWTKYYENVIAKGNYTYTGNQLTGTYTYTTSGSFSFNALMDANGTWSNGSNVRGGSKWVMTKK